MATGKSETVSGTSPASALGVITTGDQGSAPAVYSVFHTRIGERPFWYLLDRWQDHAGAINRGGERAACRRAYSYALDHGGYVCVKDAAGAVIFGTDPAGLDRAIASGINFDFRSVSRSAA